MKKFNKLIISTLIIMLFSFITFSMYAGAENNVEYDVKSYYKSEYFNSYINILLTKDDKTSLIVNIDCVKANLFLSEGKGFKHYRPKGKEYPDLHASFVNLKDNLPIVGDYKKVMVGSYDAYYKLAASKSVYEVWDFVCLIHIPELELPGGPKFLIQFDLRNRYGYKSKELPFEDYYGIEAQNKIEADFLKILNAISISYEDSNGNISQGGGAGQTVTNEAGSTTGYDAKSSADIPKAVAVAFVAILATIIGATGARSTHKDAKKNSQNEVPKSTLRMVISKNFGNEIRYGGDTVNVSAHIVEYFEKGGQQDRPDLTAQIQITTQSNCIEITPGKMAGNIIGCSVRAPMQKDPKVNDATITFSLTVGQGNFTNNVVFRLVGKPEIKIEKSINILSSEERYDLKYILIGCGENPKLNFICSSGLILADLSVGNDEKERFLRLYPSEEACEWDNKTFIKNVKCAIEVQYGEKPNEIISEELNISICYEGIGTAFLNTPNNSTPEEILIPCDASDNLREIKTYALPLTVMKWNPDKRLLESDVNEVKALSLEVLLEGNQNMKPGSEQYTKFQKIIENAKISITETKNSVKIDPKLSPTIIGLRATGQEAEEDINLLLTFTSSIPQIMPLSLKAKTSNNVDYKAMIRWLINYSVGTYSSKFIQLGDLELFYKALEHIDGVFQHDKTPNLAKGFRHRSDSNYYEHGKGDFTRDCFIALHILPTGIGDLVGVSTLYHELIHTLEDIIMDERDGLPSTGCERHTHLMEEVAKASYYLTNAEKMNGNIIENIKNAIDCISYGAYHNDTRQWLTEVMSKSLGNFGAKFTMLPKEFFYHYAVDYSGPNSEEIKRVTLQSYCPANINGTYKISDGLFAGGEMFSKWFRGVMHRFDFSCKGFTFDPDYDVEWIPDKDKLMIKIGMLVQRDGAKYKEYVNVLLEGNLTYMFDKKDYLIMPGFNATWTLGIPPGKKFYDPPADSPFYNLRTQTSTITK